MPKPKMETYVEQKTRRLREQATDVFVDQQKAERWMNEPNPALQNRRPVDLVETDEDYENVDDLLTRIASGTYS